MRKILIFLHNLYRRYFKSNEESATDKRLQVNEPFVPVERINGWAKNDVTNNVAPNYTYTATAEVTEIKYIKKDVIAEAKRKSILKQQWFIQYLKSKGSDGDTALNIGKEYGKQVKNHTHYRSTQAVKTLNTLLRKGVVERVNKTTWRIKQ
jgi:hypothetical protein